MFDPIMRSRFLQILNQLDKSMLLYPELLGLLEPLERATHGLQVGGGQQTAVNRAKMAGWDRLRGFRPRPFSIALTLRWSHWYPNFTDFPLMRLGSR